MSMDIKSTPIAVLGAGSWGTALAILLARNGNPPKLWARNADHVAEMQASHKNERYLGDVDVRVEIDRRSGDYLTYRRWQVIADEDELEFPDRQVFLSQGSQSRRGFISWID